MHIIYLFNLTRYNQVLLRYKIVILLSLISFSLIKKVCKSLTRKAIFLSLFIAENCFRRDKTAESRGLSGAMLSSTIHGWPDTEKQLKFHSFQPHSNNFSSIRTNKILAIYEILDLQSTWWAVTLVFGFLSSIFRIRSLALSEIPGHGSDRKSSFPWKICLKIPWSVSVDEKIRRTVLAMRKGWRWRKQ